MKKKLRFLKKMIRTLKIGPFGRSFRGLYGVAGCMAIEIFDQIRLQNLIFPDLGESHTQQPSKVKKSG